MATRKISPKEMAKKLVRLLRPQRLDYYYLKKVFQHTRESLRVGIAQIRQFFRRNDFTIF